MDCTNEVFSSKTPFNIPPIIHNMKKLEFFHSNQIPSVIINGVKIRGELNEETI